MTPITQIPTKTRTGIVFRPGQYPDKPVKEVTEADIEAIAAASRDAVDFDSEHGPSLFDGFLGKARNFRVGTDKGEKVLFADWDEPEPLRQLLRDTPRTVSVAFDDWNTRKVTKVALAKFPRVADAAFFSAVQGAYAAFSQGQPVQPLSFSFYSNEERDVIAIEDLADPANKLFPIRTQDEANEAMRQVWHAADPTAVKNNIIAICERKKFKLDSWPYPRPGMSAPIPVGGSSDYYFSTAPVEGQQRAFYNTSDISRVQTMQNQNNPGVNFGANNNPTNGNPNNGNNELNVFQKMAAFFGLTPEQTAAAEATFSSKTPEELRLQAENARLQAQLAQQGAQFSAQKTTPEMRAAQAANAAQKLLDEKRILPYQLEAVKADFSRALEDDVSNPVKVTFSVKDAQNNPRNVEASRFDSLQSLYGALPPHQLETEQVREMPAETIALFSREATRQVNHTPENDFDPVAYQQMTGMTPPAPAK